MMEKQKQLMKCMLDDTRLNRLRLEGGTVLARIKKEEPCENENYRCCRRRALTCCNLVVVKLLLIVLLFLSLGILLTC